MRYERLKDIVELAVLLQGSHGGVTLDDIGREFSVSRRTAERMRDAVEWAFGPLETVAAGDSRLHWRLRSNALKGLVKFAPEELAALSTAAEALERTGLLEQAGRLRNIAMRLQALHRDTTADGPDSNLEVLMQAEGLAMRPGPRERVEPGLLSLLREAILTRRVVDFGYRARASGRESRQRAEPWGILYGNRTFLVARTDWTEKPRLWRLAGMTGARLLDERFKADPDFNLKRYARRSFGTFQEKPAQVVLRFDAEAAPDAASFLFHPDQNVEAQSDGTVRVRFEAGGFRRDVLASGHLGEDDHCGKTRPPPQAARQNVRGAC